MRAMVFEGLADLALLEEARYRFKFDDDALRAALGVTDKNAFRQWRHRNFVPLDIRPRLLQILSGPADEKQRQTELLRLVDAVRAGIQGQVADPSSEQSPGPAQDAQPGAGRQKRHIGPTPGTDSRGRVRKPG